MTTMINYVIQCVCENWYWFVLGFSPFIIWGLIVTILGGLVPGLVEGWRSDSLWKINNFYKYAVRQEGCREGWWWLLGNKAMRFFNFVIAWVFYPLTIVAYGLGIILRWCWIAIKWASKNLWHGLVRVYDAI